MLRLSQRRSRRHEISITHRTIYLQRLPSCWSQLCLVQVSDIHHGLFTSLEEVERVVNLTNRFHPDLIALTGDFVSNSRNYVAPVAHALGRLCARLGVFAVLGNHDHRVGADAVETALEKSGIAVLRNQSTCIGKNGTSLVVAGVDDYSYNAYNFRDALRGVEEDASVLMLAHNPALAPLAAMYGVDLVLSGHTHGGQVGGLRHLRAAARRRKVNTPLREGSEQVGETQVYISRGIGTVVLPLRIQCPPELPVLRLESLSAPPPLEN